MSPTSRLAVCLAVVTLIVAPAAAQTSGGCERLATLAVTNARVTSAASHPAGGFATPPAGNPPQSIANPVAMCRVTATLRPSPDSDIKVEVWLPTSGWNGKYQAVGNGGWNGSINYGQLRDAVAAGYAAASTDTGHAGNTASFALGHPEKLIDFAYRSHHEMTAFAKTAVNAFYGAAPRLSIFNGCSAGGRQAVTQAARYPADYDAVIAGAPAVYSMELHAFRVALNQFVNRTPTSRIPPEKYPAVHEQIVNQCDAGDGLKDGLIGHPSSCRVDLHALACKSTDGADCLTAEQIETARVMLSPVTHPTTGAVLAPPLLVPGSELGWSTLAGPQALQNAADGLRYVVFEDTTWNPRSFNPATDVERALNSKPELFRTDTDLRPFFSRGGKLLLYHGWADPQVTPLNAIRFFDAVVAAAGPQAVATSVQLYMAPGMNHCRGGEGPDRFDSVAAMEQWMQTGTAPSRVLASRVVNGTVQRTRPLCPFPQIATYSGSGSIDDAANFECKAPPAGSGTR